MIHNLKMVCPRGHVFAAVAYDDASRTQADAAHGLGQGVRAMTQGGPPICEVCGALTFTLDDVATDYQSMREAMPDLVAEAVREMDERMDSLDAGRN